MHGLECEVLALDHAVIRLLCLGFGIDLGSALLKAVCKLGLVLYDLAEQKVPGLGQRLSAVLRGLFCTEDHAARTDGDLHCFATTFVGYGDMGRCIIIKQAIKTGHLPLCFFPERILDRGFSSGDVDGHKLNPFL